MKILYHHRTRATDAQRIHIQEMVRAFEALGNDVEVVGLVDPNTGLDDPKRDAGDPWWKKLVRRIPLSYELVQLGYNLIGLPMLMLKLLRGRVDFIYDRYALFSFSGVVAAHLCRVPLVLEVNSPVALEVARDKEIVLFRFAQWTERIICNLASHVIVVSTPLAKTMKGLGVNPSKIVVMANGVNLEAFRPGEGSAELRRKLGLENSVVLGFVGWFRNWHGLEMLLEAFRRAGLAEQK